MRASLYACIAVCVHRCVRASLYACIAVCVHRRVRAAPCACIAVCVHRRGRAALQGRVSCLEWVRASAPVVAFPRPMEFFRSLFSRATWTHQTLRLYSRRGKVFEREGVEVFCNVAIRFARYLFEICEELESGLWSPRI